MKASGQIAVALRGIDGVEVREMEPMSRHTTLQIGGPADLYVTCESASAIEAVLCELAAANCPWIVSGAGSNLLVMDEGIDGAVVVPGSGLSGINFAPDGQPIVTAGAGLNIAVLLAAVCRAGFSGLEYLTGIPGTIGGAVAMNAGTRYGYVDCSLVEVETISKRGRRVVKASELNLGYRTSSLNDDEVLTSATFTLNPGRSQDCEEIARCLSELRRNNHPPASGTAGSFFRNPDPEAGLFAGQLIEECGLKGTQVGGAVVSQKHANFLMNGGGATADDLLNLAMQVRNTVAVSKGVQLTREVKIVGRGADRWIKELP
jgi:UDP-N-acetylmuramate dehydrogenase